MKNYWMAVSADEYELPIAVGESAEELGMLLGKDRSHIYSMKSRKSKAYEGFYVISVRG